MPISELFSCRKMRLFSELSHSHDQHFLEPEYQFDKQQGVNNFEYYKAQEIGKRASGVQVASRPHLKHFCDLQEIADGVEKKRREKEEAQKHEEPEDEEPDEDLDQEMQALGEDGENVPKRKQAPGVAQAAGGAPEARKKTSTAARSKKEVKDKKSSAGGGEIFASSADMEALKESDFEMFKVATRFGSLPECLLKLNVRDILAGSKRGVSLWFVSWPDAFHFGVGLLWNSLYSTRS